MDVDAYLDRIGYGGGREPTLETLRGMHRAHAFTVPFENLDIAQGTRIQVDEDVNFEKIVRRRRGGFCLELTGLFGRVLRELGFRVDVIGARVLMDGRLALRPDGHMVLLVHLDEPWIADVGFGGRVIEPLRLRDTADRYAGERRYSVGSEGDVWVVSCSEPDNPSASYIFRARPRQFDEFHGICDWLQTSEESRFTHGSIASIARPDGRATLAGGRLIKVRDGIRDERAVSPEEEPAILGKEFGISLD